MRLAILRHQRIFVVAAVAVPVLVFLAGWHYWTLYTSLSGTRSDLLSAQARLSGASLDLTAADLAVARERLDAADANTRRARAHLRWDPLLQAARFLPVAGRQVDALDDFLRMAATLAQIGDEATAAGSSAVALRDNPPAGQPLTSSLVRLLDDTAPRVDRIDALTRELVAQRLAMGDGRLLPPLARARDRLDEELPRVANAVEQLAQARALLPGFLGFAGDRRYLVLALNSGELQPGGGLVTAAGVLPVTNGVNGTLDFADSTTWLGQWTAQGGSYIEPPGPLKRYLLRDYSWNLLVSNWSPDFPTWAQQSLQFYELVYGPQKVDGVVAVDLVVLERLLTVTGPKTIDVPGAGPVTFDANNAVLALETFTRPAYEPVAGDRKSVVGALANAVISDLLALPPERWSAAIKELQRLGKERHIQMLSFRPAEQTIIRDVRWDGRLEQPPGDWSLLSEASVMSTKLNLIIRPEGEYRVDVSALGDARHELTLRYRNPLPEWAAGKDPALVQQLMYQGLYGGYLRLFAPAGAANREVAIDGSPTSPEDAGSEGGRDWFGVLLPVPAGQTREVRFARTVALATQTQGEYELYIQKQPGTAGMCLALTITREGRPAREVTISGGSRDAQGRVCLSSDVRVRARF